MCTTDININNIVSIYCIAVWVLCVQESMEYLWCVLVQPSPKVKSPPVGRGRGTGARRGSGRGRGQKRASRAEDNVSGEEKYIPRSSKRRAAVAAVSRMKQPSDYEDDDFDDVLPARPLPVSKPPTKTGRPRGRPPASAGRGRKPIHVSDDNDSEPGQNNVDDYDSSEESASPPKKKRTSDKTKTTCQYGKECYRLVQRISWISQIHVSNLYSYCKYGTLQFYIF